MTAVAATIPFQSSNPFEPIPPSPAAPATWTPSDRDRLIFQWVKFDGRTQSWVAGQLGINQATVSRVVERFERWIAHAQPGQNGQLTHAERLRAQRWLTYERNERMLAATLRIAAEMEGVTDVSKSTITRHASDPERELEIRTVHAAIDRSSIAARFIRLAFRINDRQLELVEKAELQPLAPLTTDQIEQDEPLDGPVGWAPPIGTGAGPADQTPADDPPATLPLSAQHGQDTPAQTEPSVPSPQHSAPNSDAQAPHAPIAATPHREPETCNVEPATLNVEPGATSLPGSSLVMHHREGLPSQTAQQPGTVNSEARTLNSVVHTVHNCINAPSAPTPCRPCTCGPESSPPPPPEISREPCIAPPAVRLR